MRRNTPDGPVPDEVVESVAEVMTEAAQPEAPEQPGTRRTSVILDDFQEPEQPKSAAVEQDIDYLAARQAAEQQANMVLSLSSHIYQGLVGHLLIDDPTQELAPEVYGDLANNALLAAQVFLGKMGIINYGEDHGQEDAQEEGG